MNPSKAIGPDGMPPSFFQHFWQFLKHDIVNAIKSFFYLGRMLNSINDTLVIQMVATLINLSNFISISLGNVMYKTNRKNPC